MRGGPSLKGKGGLVGFRRSLNAKGGLLVFRRFKKLLLLFRSSREDWWVFEKTLNAKEVFRKPYSRPIYKKIKASSQ